MAYFWTIEGNEWGHPLWVSVAHWFTFLPFGDIAYRVNFSSALLSALAILFLYLTVREMTGSTSASLLAASSIAVSHTFWLFAVRGKGVYSLNSFLMLASLFLLVRCMSKGTSVRQVFQVSLAIFLLAGGIGNHLLLGTLLPGMLILLAAIPLRRPAKPTRFLVPALCFCIGIAPFLIISSNTGDSPRLVEVINGAIRQITDIQHPLRDLRDFLLYFAYQFPSPAIILGFLGLFVSLKMRRLLGLALLLMFLTVVAFNLDYDVPDKYQYFLPAYIVFAIWVGLGASWLISRLKVKAGFANRRVVLLMALLLVLAMPVSTYSISPKLAGALGLRPEGGRELPGRELLSFHLTPAKNGYTGARDFGEQVFSLLPENAIIIADYTPSQTLKYLQSVEGQRPDLLIAELYPSDQMPFILANLDRPLFLANTELYYDMESISKYFEVVPEGPIFRLQRK